jgi:hypothetical protein
MDSDPIPSPTRIDSWLSVEGLQLGLSGLAFEARHPMIESCLDLVIGARRNVTYPIGTAKFINCSPDYLPSPLWVTSFVFVINCQLLVSLIAVP